jgi:hypothetical protein
MAWTGPAGHNTAGVAGHGKAGRGKAGHNTAGMAGRGAAGRGLARLGKALQAQGRDNTRPILNKGDTWIQ